MAQFREDKESISKMLTQNYEKKMIWLHNGTFLMAAARNFSPHCATLDTSPTHTFSSFFANCSSSSHQAKQNSSKLYSRLTLQYKQHLLHTMYRNEVKWEPPQSLTSTKAAQERDFDSCFKSHTCGGLAWLTANMLEVGSCSKVGSSLYLAPLHKHSGYEPRWVHVASAPSLRVLTGVFNVRLWGDMLLCHRTTGPNERRSSETVNSQKPAAIMLS